MNQQFTEEQILASLAPGYAQYVFFNGNPRLFHLYGEAISMQYDSTRKLLMQRGTGARMLHGDKVVCFVKMPVFGERGEAHV